MFLATVSHELRTPLYGIIGNLDLLQTKALPQGVDRLVNAMNNSSGLLLKIISDILDFSKIESEQLKIEPREFSCLEVITHIAGNYLPLVVKKRLGLYCFIEQNVPERIFGDPVRLQQVLSNLVNNAIKFTDTGCIVLQVCTRGSYRSSACAIPASASRRRRFRACSIRSSRWGPACSVISRHRPGIGDLREIGQPDGRRRLRRVRAGPGQLVQHSHSIV